MLEFYQYPKCTTCKRAKAELESLVTDFVAKSVIPTVCDYLDNQ